MVIRQQPFLSLGDMPICSVWLDSLYEFQGEFNGKTLDGEVGIQRKGTIGVRGSTGCDVVTRHILNGMEIRLEYL
jgi:hypothetical protein